MTAHSVDGIIRAVAQYFWIGEAELLAGHSRDALLARRIAAHLARQHAPHMSAPQLGARMGRDHSTVTTYDRVIRRALKVGDEEVTAAVTELTQQLTQPGASRTPARKHRPPDAAPATRSDVAACPLCVNRHDRGHACPTCGQAPQITPAIATPPPRAARHLRVPAPVWATGDDTEHGTGT